MTVTVTDGKATVTKTFTFTKAVTAASITHRRTRCKRRERLYRFDSGRFPVMGLNRVRVDSVAKLQKKKTMAELQEENEALKTKVSSLETNLDNTQMALCDVYEQLIAVTSAADKEA